MNLTDKPVLLQDFQKRSKQMTPLHVINPLCIKGAIGVILAVENLIQGTCEASYTNVDAKIGRWLFSIYASAVVGTTLTNRVLVSRDFTDESAGSSEKQRDIK